MISFNNTTFGFWSNYCRDYEYTWAVSTRMLFLHPPGIRCTWHLLGNPLFDQQLCWECISGLLPEKLFVFFPPKNYKDNEVNFCSWNCWEKRGVLPPIPVSGAFGMTKWPSSLQPGQGGIQSMSADGFLVWKGIPGCPSRLYIKASLCSCAHGVMLWKCGSPDWMV